MLPQLAQWYSFCLEEICETVEIYTVLQTAILDIFMLIVLKWAPWKVDSVDIFQKSILFYF